MEKFIGLIDGLVPKDWFANFIKKLNNVFPDALATRIGNWFKTAFPKLIEKPAKTAATTVAEKAAQSAAKSSIKSAIPRIAAQGSSQHMIQQGFMESAGNIATSVPKAGARAAIMRGAGSLGAGLATGLITDPVFWAQVLYEIEKATSKHRTVGNFGITKMPEYLSTNDTLQFISELGSSNMKTQNSALSLLREYDSVLYDYISAENYKAEWERSGRRVDQSGPGGLLHTKDEAAQFIKQTYLLESLYNRILFDPNLSNKEKEISLNKLTDAVERLNEQGIDVKIRMDERTTSFGNNDPRLGYGW